MLCLISRNTRFWLLLVSFKEHSHPIFSLTSSRHIPLSFSSTRMYMIKLWLKWKQDSHSTWTYGYIFLNYITCNNYFSQFFCYIHRSGYLYPLTTTLSFSTNDTYNFVKMFQCNNPHIEREVSVFVTKTGLADLDWVNSIK